MAKDPDNLAASFDTENTGGFLTGFLADEEQLDRRSLWRLGSWGVASVGAVVVAVLANQTSIGFKRDQLAAADLTRQSQQLQSVAKAAQSETRRLASAVDTLNDDRDRLYSRVAVLEQGLESVTGAIAKQNPAPGTPPAANNTPPPVVAPVATTPVASNEKPSATPTVADPTPAVSSTATIPSPKPSTPDVSAAGKTGEPAATAGDIGTPPATDAVASTEPIEDTDPEVAEGARMVVQRTEFGADVGGANSLEGLRSLWRGLLKSNKSLAALRPIIVVKEGSNRPGMQLRLVVGPVTDAAATAKICAALIESKRPCETTVFDGQRLTLKPEEIAPPIKPAARKRGVAKGAAVEAPSKPETSTFSALFGRH